MALEHLPEIVRLHLADVTRVPDWHPEYAAFQPFPVYGWLIRHPNGLVLVDTDIAPHPILDEWYGPVITRIEDALRAVGVEPHELAGIVLSHLHFDHCGQQSQLLAPVYVQAAEIEAAKAPRYTQAEALEFGDRLRPLTGDHVLLQGIRLLATPGHTPGHQSVLVEGGGERVVLAAQCAFRGAEIESGEPAVTNLHAVEWREAARLSLARVREFAPSTIYLSHDPDPVQLRARAP